MSTGALLATACSGTPQVEVCQQQIVVDVASRFQQKVTHIDFSFAESRPAPITTPPRTGRAVVRVEECSGYHVYEVLGTDYDCLYRPHYGLSQRYVWYRTSAEGCEG
jgi:hypothetical protein